MRIPKMNQCMRFYNGEKVSRKVKKFFIGKKCTKKSLRKRMKDVRVTEKNIYGETILSDYFCPKCGCELERSNVHYVEYPEIWTDYDCARCGYRTATEDNSPYIHCLEDVIANDR